MIKLETHCHSIGGSPCAKCEPEFIAEKYAKNGYGGIVLTNHYCQVCYDGYDGATHAQKVDFYMSLFKRFEKACISFGLKSFMGAEVRAVTDDGTYKEFMLYGVTEKLLKDNPPLFYLTQKQMFEFAQKNGLFMYQTHPFRKGVATGDYRFMHGAEAFNGHINHINDNQVAEKFCFDHNLIPLSGTDYHDPDQVIDAGIYISDGINTEQELLNYIKSGKAELIEDSSLYEKFLRAK